MLDLAHGPARLLRAGDVSADRLARLLPGEGALVRLAPFLTWPPSSSSAPGTSAARHRPRASCDARSTSGWARAASRSARPAPPAGRGRRRRRSRSRDRRARRRHRVAPRERPDRRPDRRAPTCASRWRASTARRSSACVPDAGRPHVHDRGARARYVDGARERRTCRRLVATARDRRATTAPRRPVDRRRRRPARDAARDLPRDGGRARRARRSHRRGAGRPRAPGWRREDRARRRPRGVPPQGGAQARSSRARGTRCTTTGRTRPSPSTTRRSAPPRRATWRRGSPTARSCSADRARASRSRRTRCDGVRAALCHDLYLARLSREHNDANVLAMGGARGRRRLREGDRDGVAGHAVRGRTTPAADRADRGHRTRGAVRDA